MNTLWCAFLEASVTLIDARGTRSVLSMLELLRRSSHPPGYCCAKPEASMDGRVTSAPLSEALSLASASRRYHRRGSEPSSPCFSLVGL